MIASAFFPIVIYFLKVIAFITHKRNNVTTEMFPMKHIKYPDEKKEWQTESPSKFFVIFVH